MSASSSACRHAWEQRQLGEVVQIVGGGTPDSSNADYWDGDIDWYTPSEIGERRSVETSARKITPEGLVHSSARLLPAGSILFTSRASIGLMAFISRPSATNQGFQSLVPSNNVDSNFLYALGPYISRYAKKHAAGSTFIEISGSSLAKAPLRIPSLAEQRRIGVFFSTLDSLIAAAERQEALLRQKKQAYLQLMFPQEGETRPRLRFNGFSGEWESLQLGKLYEKNTERNGNQFDAGKTLSVSSMTFNAFGNGAAEESLTTYKVLRIGDAAFEGHTSNEFAFGRFVVNTIGDGIMSPRFTAIRPTARWRQSCDLDFWSCYLHDENVMKRILVRSTKRGTMMNELVLDDFFTERIRVPSLPEQRHIGKFFSTLESLIAAAEERTKHLRELKGSYLQRMFA
ncbi:restriction endonuclease subunit S [Pseudoscardovia radai]|uniref:restriction endonuclease subunit S n=1 Tax=Pseudoscardovia radai TaxID=987066 RepID=UPI00399531C1